MTNEASESVAMQDIVPQKVHQNELIKPVNNELRGDDKEQVIVIGNIPNKIINDRNDYLNDFLDEINKLEYNCCCLCSAGCNLWVGVHCWLIWFIIGNFYSIYSLKTILDLLSISCQPDIKQYEDEYIACSQQEALYDAGYTSAIIECYFVFHSIGLFINFAGFYGIYRCVPICILLPIIFILLASVNGLFWIIKTWELSFFNFIVITEIILRLWPIYILFTCYQFAKYFKNGGTSEMQFK